MGKLVNHAIENEPACIKNYRNVDAWRRMWKWAMANPNKLLDLQTEVIPILKDFFDHHNEDPQGPKGDLPSRREVYEQTPHVALPAPNELELAHFQFARKAVKGSLSHKGIRYEGEWEPVLTDNEEENIATRRRWATAVAGISGLARRKPNLKHRHKPTKSKKVPVYILETIEGEQYVIASVDGVTWERVVKKGEQKASSDVTLKRRRGAILEDGADIKSILQPAEEAMKEKYGGALIRSCGKCILP